MQNIEFHGFFSCIWYNFTIFTHITLSRLFLFFTFYWLFVSFRSCTSCTLVSLSPYSHHSPLQPLPSCQKWNTHKQQQRNKAQKAFLLYVRVCSTVYPSVHSFSLANVHYNESGSRSLVLWYHQYCIFVRTPLGYPAVCQCHVDPTALKQ